MGVIRKFIVTYSGPFRVISMFWCIIICNTINILLTLWDFFDNWIIQLSSCQYFAATKHLVLVHSPPWWNTHFKKTDYRWWYINVNCFWACFITYHNETWHTSWCSLLPDRSRSFLCVGDNIASHISSYSLVP